MRYVTFSTSDGVERMGVLRDTQVLDLGKLAGSQGGGDFPTTVLELIEAGPETWRRAALLVESAFQSPSSEAIIGIEKVRLHAPIPHPRKNIVCLGLNYVAHMRESAKARGRQAKVPEVPVFFTKAVTSVNGPFDAIPWDTSVTSEVDYEAELGVIIGVGGKNIARADALDHVFGYTIINDFSARDLQLRHYQWFKGKSLDGFCPMGPYVVTADELGDPQQKQVSLRVNGVTRQSATTADMIFPIPVIIEFLSRGLTLEPGDIISTGTPEGVGLGHTPPQYLKDGDLVETEVEGIGVLRNRITAVRVAAGERSGSPRAPRESTA